MCVPALRQSGFAKVAQTYHSNRKHMATFASRTVRQLAGPQILPFLKETRSLGTHVYPQPRARFPRDFAATTQEYGMFGHSFPWQHTYNNGNLPSKELTVASTISSRSQLTRPC